MNADSFHCWSGFHSHPSLDKHGVIQLVLGDFVSLAKKAITSLSEMSGASVPLELRRDMFSLVCVCVCEGG